MDFTLQISDPYGETTIKSETTGRSNAMYWLAEFESRGLRVKVFRRVRERDGAWTGEDVTAEFRDVIERRVTEEGGEVRSLPIHNGLQKGQTHDRETIPGGPDALSGGVSGV